MVVLRKDPSRRALCRHLKQQKENRHEKKLRKRQEQVQEPRTKPEVREEKKKNRGETRTGRTSYYRWQRVKERVIKTCSCLDKFNIRTAREPERDCEKDEEEEGRRQGEERERTR